MGSGTTSSPLTGWLMFAFALCTLVILMTIAIGVRSWRSHDGRFGLVNALVLMELVIALALIALVLVVDTGRATIWLLQIGSAVFAVAGGLTLIIFVALVALAVRAQERR